MGRAVLFTVLLVFPVAACSSGGSAKGSTSERATTSAAAASSTTGELPDLSPGPRIESFTGPPAPVPCSAPTSVELHWQTPVTATVELRIDGGEVFATYPGGRGDHLVPLVCDGRAQTYELTVTGADGTTAIKSLTIEERPPA